MPGKCKEIGIQIPHIDRHVRGRLCTVHHGDCPLAVRTGNHLFHRIGHAKHIGYLRNGQDFTTVRDLAFVFLFGNDAFFIGLQPYQMRPRFFCGDLPRQNIGMMLHHGEHHLVSFMQMALSIALRNEVQGFCCVSGKNNLLVLRCVNELCYGVSCFLVFGSCI